jgi:hypothetical protein
MLFLNALILRFPSWKKGIGLNPEQNELKYRLGAYLLLSGRRVEALRCWKTFGNRLP